MARRRGQRLDARARGRRAQPGAPSRSDWQPALPRGLARHLATAWGKGPSGDDGDGALKPTTRPKGAWIRRPTWIAEAPRAERSSTLDADGASAPKRAGQGGCRPSMYEPGRGHPAWLARRRPSPSPESRSPSLSRPSPCCISWTGKPSVAGLVRRVARARQTQSFWTAGWTRYRRRPRSHGQYTGPHLGWRRGRRRPDRRARRRPVSVRRASPPPLLPSPSLLPPPPPFSPFPPFPTRAAHRGHLLARCRRHGRR